MPNIFSRVTNYMVENHIIPAEDYAIYEYGLQQGSIFLLNIVTILLLGLFNHKVLESIFFIFAYFPLRTFAGGFHARTQLRCYFGGIILIQCVLWAIQWIPHTSPALIVLGLIAFLIIFTLVPVADANKPLTQKEKQVYRKKAHHILFVVLVTAVILYLLHFFALAATVVISLVALAIMLLLGYPKQPAIKQS